MSKPIKLIPHETDQPIEKWHKKIREIKDNGVKLKMLVIEKIMANPNISAKEVQETFFISPRLMYKWIEEYNSKGLEGLKAKKPEGRGSGKGNLKVADEVYISLKEEMAKDPTRKWTGKEKQQYIKEKFNIEVTQAGIAYRLKRL